jgi:hypothetical protein
LGVQREVRISAERVRHIRVRRRKWAGFCLQFMAEVLAAPGHRVLLVSVKFLDERGEAWINSAYPIDETVLTRRLRNGTLGGVHRGS